MTWTWPSVCGALLGSTPARLALCLVCPSLGLRRMLRLVQLSAGVTHMPAAASQALLARCSSTCDEQDLTLLSRVLHRKAAASSDGRAPGDRRGARQRQRGGHGQHARLRRE